MRGTETETDDAKIETVGARRPPVIGVYHGLLRLLGRAAVRGPQRENMRGGTARLLLVGDAV